MKHYIQFLSEINGRQINASGTDGVYIFSDEKNIKKMIKKAEQLMSLKSKFVGFKILKANHFTDDEVVLHTRKTLI